MRFSVYIIQVLAFRLKRNIFLFQLYPEKFFLFFGREKQSTLGIEGVTPAIVNNDTFYLIILIKPLITAKQELLFPHF